MSSVIYLGILSFLSLFMFVMKEHEKALEKEKNNKDKEEVVNREPKTKRPTKKKQ